jgi:glycosyltransferase involved in cell wall biosynthesis
LTAESPSPAGPARAEPVADRDGLVEKGRTGPAPTFSICVPQHNRTSFFVRAIASYAGQTFRDVEVCVSDGGSTDGREGEVLDALTTTGLPFAYRRSPVNLRYDPNLRAAIGLARGRYCVLMGNDDAFNGPAALAGLWAEMRAAGYPGVVLNDSCDDRTGERAWRVRSTAVVGAGPRVASRHYRNFSFVSGVVLEREPVQALAGGKWDGSEMYQTYVGCRLIASGRPLMERGVPFTRKDLVVPGETVESLASRPRLWPCPIVTRRTTLTDFGRLVVDAVAPFAGADARRFNEDILFQHLGITGPNMLTVYRRFQSWRYAAGVALGLRPTLSADGVPLGAWRRTRVWAVYLAGTAFGLGVPLGLFDRFRGTLYRLAKSIR